jgi:hypothetical protein
VEGRGFLTWAAVGLVAIVALFALVDTLRDLGASTPEPARTAAETTTTAASTTTTGPAPRPEAPPGWQEGVLQGVLTFEDANDCTIRSIGLAGGRERPVPGFVTACTGFWAPPIGARLAFVSPPESSGTIRFVDLGSPNADLGTFIANGDVHWSADGQRAAWCADPRLDIGIELENFGGEARQLPHCPIAYTTGGELAYAEGRHLIVGDRTVARMPSPIRFAQFGPGGALVLVDFRGLVRRFGADPVRAGPVGGWNGLQPVFSPDLCLAAFPRPLGFTLVELGCAGEVVYGRIPGTAAAWSPDSRWLAVAAEGEIRFYPAGSTGAPSLVWPAQALTLAWRP